MEQKRNIILVCVALALITAAFLAVKLVGESVFLGTHHQLSPGALEGLASSLAGSNQIIGLAQPSSLAWLPGESGVFGAGVKSTYPEERIFYFRVIFESVLESASPPSQAEQWVSFPSQKAIPAGGIETFEILVRPVNPPAGSYFYRLLVCETEQCQSLSSPGIYATATFSFRVLPAGSG